MPFAVGSTLTDLGRNLVDQRATDNALAGIMAQVNAQKLAALNALAANQGRTRADREVGLDRNATMREAAVLESLLKGQELSDRDRQYQAQIAAAQELARMQGANNLAVAGVPYGPEALKMAETLARMQGANQKDIAAMPYGPEALKMAQALAAMQQRVDPRLMGDIIGQNIQAEERESEAASIAAQANMRADLALQKFNAAKRSPWKTTLNPFYGDADYEQDYVAEIAGIPASFGEAAGLIEPVRLPDGTFQFKPKRFSRIVVPQINQPNTGTTNAVPIPPPIAQTTTNMAVPPPAAKIAAPPGDIAELQKYAAHLVAEARRLASLPPNQSTPQRAAFLQQEIAKVRNALAQ